MKCYLCEKRDGRVLTFSDESFQKCYNVVAFRRKKKYKYGDLRLGEESRNNYGYHSACNGKVTVLKQKDREEFEAFLKNNSNVSETISITTDFKYLVFINNNVLL